MFILIEIDKIYCGFGLDCMEFIYGIRLGWIGIHIAFYPFQKCFNVKEKIEKGL